MVGGLEMSKSSTATRVVGALADATGRTDEEVALALTVGAAVAGVTSALLAALRLLNFFEDLGVYVLGPRKRA